MKPCTTRGNSTSGISESIWKIVLAILKSTHNIHAVEIAPRSRSFHRNLTNSKNILSLAALGRPPAKGVSVVFLLPIWIPWAPPIPRQRSRSSAFTRRRFGPFFAGTSSRTSPASRWTILGSHVCSHYTFGTVFLCHSRSERRGVGRVWGDSGVENDGCGDVLLTFFCKKAK